MPQHKNSQNYFQTFALPLLSLSPQKILILFYLYNFRKRRLSNSETLDSRFKLIACLTSAQKKKGRKSHTRRQQHSFERTPDVKALFSLSEYVRLPSSGREE